MQRLLHEVLNHFHNVIRYVSIFRFFFSAWKKESLNYEATNAKKKKTTRTELQPAIQLHSTSGYCCLQMDLPHLSSLRIFFLLHEIHNQSNEGKQRDSYLEHT